MNALAQMRHKDRYDCELCISCCVVMLVDEQTLTLRRYRSPFLKMLPLNTEAVNFGEEHAYSLVYWEAWLQVRPIPNLLAPPHHMVSAPRPWIAYLHMLCWSWPLKWLFSVKQVVDQV